MALIRNTSAAIDHCDGKIRKIVKRGQQERQSSSPSAPMCPMSERTVRILANSVRLATEATLRLKSGHEAHDFGGIRLKRASDMLDLHADALNYV